MSAITARPAAPSEAVGLSALHCGVEALLSGCTAILDHLFIRGMEDLDAAVHFDIACKTAHPYAALPTVPTHITLAAWWRKKLGHAIIQWRADVIEALAALPPALRGRCLSASRRTRA